MNLFKSPVAAPICPLKKHVHELVCHKTALYMYTQLLIKLIAVGSGDNVNFLRNLSLNDTTKL